MHFTSPPLVTAQRWAYPMAKSTMPVVNPVRSRAVGDDVAPTSAEPQHLRPPVLVKPHERNHPVCTFANA